MEEERISSWGGGWGRRRQPNESQLSGSEDQGDGGAITEIRE
jgi:hypothetical protein